MPDEAKFDRAIRNAGNFINIDHSCELLHPTLPGVKLETDNICQKKQTIFLFEGKTKDQATAFSQLKIRAVSLQCYKEDYINSNRFNKYYQIRLFFYSLYTRTLIEFDLKGNRIKTNKFDDLGILAEILRKL